VWFIKTITLVIMLFGIFWISGYMATWVFKLTGCIWSGSAIFGVLMVTSGLSLALTESWTWLIDLIGY